MKLYLAGPMSNYPAFNYPAFFEAAKILRDYGLDIVSPAEQDTPEELEIILASKTGAHSDLPPGRSYSSFLAADVKLVMDECAGIVFLPNWHKSSGARLEGFIALTAKKKVFAEYLNTVPHTRTPHWVRQLLRNNMP